MTSPETSDGAERQGLLVPWFLVRMAGYSTEILDELAAGDTASSVEFWHSAHTRVTSILEREPSLLAAIALSSPDAHDGIRRTMDGRHQSPGQVERSARVAVMYLQRFAAKNDTAGFFGPHYWGSWSTSDVVPLAESADQMNRRSYLSHWAAQSIIEAVDGAGPRRLLPAVRPVGDALVTVFDFEREPPTVSDIQPPGDQTKFSAPASVFPAGVMDAMTWASSALSAADLDPLRTAASYALAGSLHALATAPLADTASALKTTVEAFQTITGHEGSRGHGQHYQDRHVAYIEASPRWTEFRMGSAVQDAVLCDLGPFVRLLTVLPVARAHAKQRRMADWCRSAFPRQGTVGMRAFLERYADDAPQLWPSIMAEDDAARHEWGAWLAATLGADRWSGDTVSLEPSQLAAAADRAFDQLGHRNPVYSNVDILVDRQRRVVLGEVHLLGDRLTETTCADQAPGGLVDAVRRALEASAGSAVLVRPVFRTRMKTDTFRRLGTLECELTGWSRGTPREKLNIWDLRVSWDDERSWLEAPGIGPIIFTVAPSADWETDDEHRSLLGAFGLPRAEDASDLLGSLLQLPLVPRIMSGRAIVQRRAWRQIVSRGNRPAVDWLLDQQRQLTLPRRVFARASHLVKPIYVDFDNPLLVATAARALLQDDAVVRFSEMLPEPEDCLLRGADGPRTSELRIGLLTKGAGPLDPLSGLLDQGSADQPR
jgi:hypothetical protein